MSPRTVLAVLLLFPADDLDARMAELWTLLGLEGPGDERPWLGVSVEDSADPPGVRLTAVSPGSPAAAAGLAPVDVLLEFFGRVVVGGIVPNRYAGEFAVVIDLGGDDLYAGVRGGAGRDSILLDLGGDDTYRSASRGQAYAVLAASFLVDWSGDDLYEGENEVQCSRSAREGRASAMLDDSPWRARVLALGERRSRSGPRLGGDAREQLA